MRVVLDGFPLIAPWAGIGQYTSGLVHALAAIAPANDYVLFYFQQVKRLRRVRPPLFAERCVTVAAQGWGRSLGSGIRRRLGRAEPVERFVGPFDVFHATNYLFTLPVSGAKRVVTVHDLTLVLFPEWHPADRRRRMQAGLAAAVDVADRVIADSASTGADLVKHFSVASERVVIVPLAAGSAFRLLPRPEVDQVLRGLGLAYGGYLLFVGTLEPRKNLARLLEALASTEETVGPLVVAGSHGWKTGAFTPAMERFQGAGRVRYLGFVPDAALPALMNGARALVYPSLYEGFGLPVLEAMACGTPVLTSNAASLPEVAGGAALLVDPHDVGAIAEGMSRLWMDDQLRADLRVRGLVRAGQFSWERTARLTLEAYETACRA